MSFLEKIGLSIITNEKKMLTALRKAAGDWSNELVDPFFILLSGDVNAENLSSKSLKRIREMAKRILKEKVSVNSGDEVAYKLDEISKSIGIPLFSGRKALRKKTEEFLESGDYLKAFIYGDFISDNKKKIQSGISQAIEKWEDFEKKREVLVKQINKQLANIG